jgi:sugar phosphate isomerase/epimerase
MEECSEGEIDYREVARYLRGIGYQGYLVVELAYEKQTRVTRPVAENLRRSRAYAARVFL